MTQHGVAQCAVERMLRCRPCGGLYHSAQNDAEACPAMEIKRTDRAWGDLRENVF